MSPGAPDSATGSAPAHPVPEKPAERTETGKQPHPRYPDRWADGTTRPGFAGPALKSGRFAKSQNLPPEFLNCLDDLDSFSSGLEADQGGGEEIQTIRRGYIDKLTSVEGLYRLLAADVIQRGIFTRRGRTRSTFTALLAVIEKWDRLAQRLGMERRQRDVLDVDIKDYKPADLAPDQGRDEQET